MGFGCYNLWQWHAGSEIVEVGVVPDKGMDENTNNLGSLSFFKHIKRVSNTNTNNSGLVANFF